MVSVIVHFKNRKKSHFSPPESPSHENHMTLRAKSISTYTKPPAALPCDPLVTFICRLRRKYNYIDERSEFIGELTVSPCPLWTKSALIRCVATCAFLVPFSARHAVTYKRTSAQWEHEGELCSPMNSLRSCVAISWIASTKNISASMS